ncbi:hypothetical protein KSE_69210 [Kitasatospora setae KM-6054]|uniref:Acetyltransferase n=1 Tax=Kitasatospora setae (strain ATCC 33774 / DSM 43861 / JCM 3304 / KCC A-0304 / NBRC 14216 / KM-6054) TaxID=452652 RepID=E4N3E6_KITSK|nr:hypothetical protein KSE_69210 [Kitasatospora setae KM-6054]
MFRPKLRGAASTVHRDPPTATGSRRAVGRRGLRALTLVTFRSVPWNAPYYLRLGFRELPAADLTLPLRELLAEEAVFGLDPADRVCLHRPTLPRPAPTPALAADVERAGGFSTLSRPATALPGAGTGRRGERELSAPLRPRRPHCPHCPSLQELPP